MCVRDGTTLRASGSDVARFFRVIRHSNSMEKVLAVDSGIKSGKQWRAEQSIFALVSCW